MKYTVEGHEIVRDGEYETTEGERRMVVYINPDEENDILTLARTGSEEWLYPLWSEPTHLIRPWKEKPEKNTRAITDDMVERSADAIYLAVKEIDLIIEPKPFKDLYPDERMYYKIKAKAALIAALG